MTKSESALDLWVTETHRGVVGLRFKVRKTLFEGRSPYQQIHVVETVDHGRMLLNDGMVMLSERDEFVYHEMIAHVPLAVHPLPKRVLIVGGGDGGTAREVLKHPSIEHVKLVEIDEMVVSASREYLPSLSVAFDDPRLEVTFDDGVHFVAHTDHTFDVVIVDSTDPVGPAEPLFDRLFYKNVSRILTPGGIMVTQAESPYYDHIIQKTMLTNQRPFFNRLHLYLFSNLTYPGGLWGFGLGSKRFCPVGDFDAERFERAAIVTRYYTPQIHHAAFALPAFVEQNLKGVIDTVGK
jgi:spermidine synthase